MKLSAKNNSLYINLVNKITNLMKANCLAALLCILFCYCLSAQNTIEGIVKDQAGWPVIGANVSVKKTSIGTQTDHQGRFKIALPAGSKLLTISYIGFQPFELEITTQSFVEVVLQEGLTLEEAFVTALGIKRNERSLGYGVEKIKGNELTTVPQANLVNLLAGRAAGMTVLGSAGGNLGGSSRITIRGLRSIIGENQPLFVVDGVPMDNSNFTNLSQIKADGQGTVYESQRDYGNAIQDLNPEDIENINILKGQAAAALYGSRGANGVIIINTKKAALNQKGLGITVSSSITFDRVAVYPKFQKKYGGGVNLFPRGYQDASGFYKVPFIEFGPDGDTVGIFQSFDLIPLYGVDESSGTSFQTGTDEHFKNLDGFTINGHDQYHFINGYGAPSNRLYFRDWNSWDSWDTEHFGKSRLWEVGDDPIKFFETGVSTQQSISIEEANDKIAYRLAYHRFDQKGIYPNSKLGRNHFTANASLKLTNKLNISTSMNYVNSDNKGRSASTYDFRGGFNPGQNFSQWWQTQLRFDDLKSYENPDGSMRTWNRQSADNPRPQYWDNPYWSRYKNFETDGRNRIFGNVTVNYALSDWLQIRGRILNDFYNEKREERIAQGSLLEAQYTLDEYYVNEMNTDLQVQVERKIYKDLDATAVLGANKLKKSLERDFGATIGGLNIPGIYRLQNSKQSPLVQNILSEKEINSFYGALSFAWKNKVYLELTGRQDWSSTLPVDHNSYFYPSASLSYVFSDDLKISNLSFGKLRLAWAKVGSDGDPYSIYKTYVGNPNFGNYANYTVSNTLNKLDLKPEQTESWEAGFDLRFFNDRAGIDLCFYTGKTLDQIIPLATSATTGFTRQFINAGEMSNTGFELVLHGIPIRKTNFSWELDFQFGKNQNKVVSLVPGDKSIQSLPLASPGAISIQAQIGQPYGTIFGYNYLYDKSGNKLIDPNTGFYLKSNSVMPIGNISPDFTGGITNSFRWKNFDFNFFIDFRKGGDIVSFTNAVGIYSGLFEETAQRNYKENEIVYDGIYAVLDSKGRPILEGGGGTETLTDDYYKSNGEKNITRVSYDDHKFFDGFFHVQKRYVYDASFIKLREISIRYKLQTKWLERAGLTDVSFAIVSRNVAILHKNLPHLDPEMAVSTSNIYGNEGGAVPSTRSIGFNLKFKF